MNAISKTVILFFVLLMASTVQAQRKTEIGLSGGAARFYPEPQHLGSSLNNRMDNAWGWSAGVFIQDYWKPKIHQIIEINYYSLSSDVFYKRTQGVPMMAPENKPVYGNFDNTSFNQLAISGGIKYFFNKTLFVYPGFEIARALNNNVDINKTTYNLKLGAGVNLGRADVFLEYAYGLNYQRMIYDATVPFASTHRNTFLQLKVQVPLYNLK